MQSFCLKCNCDQSHRPIATWPKKTGTTVVLRCNHCNEERLYWYAVTKLVTIEEGRLVVTDRTDLPKSVCNPTRPYHKTDDFFGF